MKKFLKGLGVLGVFALVATGCWTQKQETSTVDTQPPPASYEEPKPSADETVPTIEEQEVKERVEVANDKQYYDEAVANNDPSKCELIINDLVKNNCLQNVKSAEESSAPKIKVKKSDDTGSE